MNGYQLYGLFAPVIGAAFVLVYVAIGLHFNRAAYRRSQSEALPPISRKPHGWRTRSSSPMP